MFANIGKVSNKSNGYYEKVLRKSLHRMRSREENGDIAVVVNLNRFRDREVIRKQVKTLKETNFYVNEEFPKELADQRHKLVPKMYEARCLDFIKKTLYVDGSFHFPSFHYRPGTVAIKIRKNKTPKESMKEHNCKMLQARCN